MCWGGDSQTSQSLKRNPQFRRIAPRFVLSSSNIDGRVGDGIGGDGCRAREVAVERQLGDPWSCSCMEPEM